MKTRWKRVLLTVPVLLAGVQLRASFPEPDALVFGLLGQMDLAALEARSSGGQVVGEAEAIANGHYLIRIRVDSDQFDAGPGRVGAVRLGEVVEIFEGNESLHAFVVTRGYLFRRDGSGEGAEGFRRGDFDGSGSVDITDPISNLTYQFLGGVDLHCEDAADTNDDGAVNISDPVHNLSYLFLGKAPPPAPGPENCGDDPTPDGLACEVSHPDCETDGNGGALRQKSSLVRGPESGEKTLTNTVLPGEWAGGLAEKPAADEVSDPRGSLRIDPPEIHFGTLAGGVGVTRTLLIHNPGSSVFDLGEIRASSARIEVFQLTSTIEPGATTRVGVRFSPEPGEGSLEPGTEVLLPGGLSVPVHASVRETGNLIRLREVLVSSGSWDLGAEILVPVELPLSEGELPKWSVGYPGDSLRLDGLIVSGESGEIIHELAPMLIREPGKGHALTRADFSGMELTRLSRMDAFPGVRVALRFSPVGVMRSERVFQVLGMDSTSSDPGESGDLLDGTSSLSGVTGHGEIIIGDSLLDLDGDGQVTISGDAVLAMSFLRENVEGHGGLSFLTSRSQERLVRRHLDRLNHLENDQLLECLVARAARIELSRSVDRAGLLEFLGRSEEAPDSVEVPNQALFREGPEATLLEGGRLVVSGNLNSAVLDLESPGTPNPISARAHRDSIYFGEISGQPGLWRVVVLGEGGGLLDRGLWPLTFGPESRQGQDLGDVREGPGARLVRAVGSRRGRSFRIPIRSSASIGEEILREASQFSSIPEFPDCDGNGMVQLSDALSLLGYLFRGNPPPVSIDRCDLNESSGPDLGDALAIVHFLYGSRQSGS